MHISNNTVRYLTALIPNGYPVYGARYSVRYLTSVGTLAFLHKTTSSDPIECDRMSIHCASSSAVVD